jgi:hypothetical protein
VKPYCEKEASKKGLVEGAQCIGSEFKSQYCRTKEGWTCIDHLCLACSTPSWVQSTAWYKRKKAHESEIERKIKPKKIPVCPSVYGQINSYRIIAVIVIAVIEF